MDFGFKFSIAFCFWVVGDGKGGNGRLLCWVLAVLSVVYPPLVSVNANQYGVVNVIGGKGWGGEGAGTRPLGEGGGWGRVFPPPQPVPPEPSHHPTSSFFIFLSSFSRSPTSGGLMKEGGGPLTAASPAQGGPRWTAVPPSARRPPVPFPVPPPAPRGTRGQTAVWFGVVVVVVVPRPAALPPVRPPPAPRGTRTTATAVAASPRAAAPATRQRERVEEVERPKSFKWGEGGLGFQKLWFLAKYGFFIVWQGSGWGGLWPPPSLARTL